MERKVLKEALKHCLDYGVPVYIHRDEEGYSWDTVSTPSKIIEIDPDELRRDLNEIDDFEKIVDIYYDYFF